MEEKTTDQLPAVELYSLGPKQAQLAAPLLTGEARDLIAQGEAFALAAVEEGRARGAVCARLAPGNGELLDLISLYVEPAFRRRQLGGTLLLELLDQVAEVTGGELRGVRALFPADAKGVEELLTRAGFAVRPAEGVQCWQFPVARLGQSPLLVQKGRSGAMSLGGLPEHRLRQLCLTLEHRGAAYLTQEEMVQAHPAFSSVLLEEDGRPAACAMFFQEAEKLVLGLFFVEPGQTHAAVGVLQTSARAILAKAPAGSQLEIPTLADSATHLVQRLLGPDLAPVPTLEGLLLC